MAWSCSFFLQQKISWQHSTRSDVEGVDLSLFLHLMSIWWHMMASTVKPLENLVNLIILGCFISLYNKFKFVRHFIIGNSWFGQLLESIKNQYKGTTVYDKLTTNWKEVRFQCIWEMHLYKEQGRLNLIWSLRRKIYVGCFIYNY